MVVHCFVVVICLFLRLESPFFEGTDQQWLVFPFHSQQGCPQEGKSQLTLLVDNPTIWFHVELNGVVVGAAKLSRLPGKLPQ